MTHPVSGMFYLRSALSLAIGIGSVITGSYVATRLKEKQDMEARLNRMEQILDKAINVKDQPAQAAKPAARPAPRRTSKSTKK